MGVSVWLLKWKSGGLVGVYDTRAEAELERNRATIGEQNGLAIVELVDPAQLLAELRKLRQQLADERLLGPPAELLAELDVLRAWRERREQERCETCRNGVIDSLGVGVSCLHIDTGGSVPLDWHCADWRGKGGDNG